MKSKHLFLVNNLYKKYRFVLLYIYVNKQQVPKYFLVLFDSRATATNRINSQHDFYNHAPPIHAHQFVSSALVNFSTLYAPLFGLYIVYLSIFVSVAIHSFS